MTKLQQIRKEAVERHERLLAYLDAHSAVLHPLLEEIEKLEPHRIDVDDGYTNLNITGDKHKLNAVFGLLRRHGFMPAERPKAGNSSYSTFFRNPDDASAPTLWLSFSSTQCRRVKVGSRTRTIEEDIYETVCDEQEYPEVKPSAEVVDEMPF